MVTEESGMTRDLHEKYMPLRSDVIEDKQRNLFKEE